MPNKTSLPLASGVLFALAGCEKKVECGANDMQLKPGHTVVVGGQMYTAGDKPCCVAIRDGELVSNCTK